MLHGSDWEWLTPAEVDTGGENPGPGERVDDSEGYGESEEEIRESETEDEDVSGSPHLLPTHGSDHDTQVTRN